MALAMSAANATIESRKRIEASRRELDGPMVPRRKVPGKCLSRALATSSGADGSAPVWKMIGITMRKLVDADCLPTGQAPI
jgi:hypothetical protein